MADPSSSTSSSAGPAGASSASSQLDDLLSGKTASAQHRKPPPSGFILEELSPTQQSPWTSVEGEFYVGASHPVNMSVSSPHIPAHFTSLPLIRDLLRTDTSLDQDDTVQECLPYLAALSNDFERYNAQGIPHLERVRHVRFLHKSLQNLPAAFVGADAARPWFFYWVLCALGVLGEDVTTYRERLISTVRPMQNSSGGFAGGNGQMSHLAPTYAVVLSLAMVGGEEAMALIDRKAMWEWLGALKKPDGGFGMSVGGEEDVRGAYCAVLILTLLDLPLEMPANAPSKSRGLNNFLDGLGEYVGRCQSFEGGLASRPDGEAHGSYAFCALACLCIIGDPQIVIPKFLDVPLLVSWLSARQYAPEGGFAGRTNKLVDGCYSHWIGGCWPLIEAALSGPHRPTDGESRVPLETHENLDTYYSREGLTRYILCCCQDTGRRGGMRDKPGKMSDAYHTCYVLAGLSSAQHKWSFGVPHARSPSVSGNLLSPYQWTSQKYPMPGLNSEEQIFDEEDTVETLHPVFAIPKGAAELMRHYFAAKEGF